MPNASQQGLLDVPATAAYLGVTERFVRELIARRRLTHVKVGRLVRFRPADLDAYVSANVRDVVA